MCYERSVQRANQAAQTAWLRDLFPREDELNDTAQQPGREPIVPLVETEEELLATGPGPAAER
jgi:hypothetical protein